MDELNLDFIKDLKNYDFSLDSSLIAQKPLEVRDEAKFLVYDTLHDKIFHKKFFDIPEFFKKGDYIILNNSKVIPVKIFINSRTFEKREILLVKEINSGKDFIDYIFLGKLSKFKTGDIFYFNDIKIEFLSRTLDNLNGICRFYASKEKLIEYLNNFGKMPLPPYIKREQDFLEIDKFDKDRYQNVYAKHLGSIACPTAGLHFTNRVLEKLEFLGIKIKKLTLHVGIGTFRPIKTNNILEHEMLGEKYFISDDLVDILLNENSNITSCGTTTTRSIENFFLEKEKDGIANIFIYPSYKFHINRLITNFHVPKSTPLILMVAFLSHKLKNNGEPDSIKKAFLIFHKIYEEAINKNYRFYSYGDSMMII